AELLRLGRGDPPVRGVHAQSGGEPPVAHDVFPAGVHVTAVGRFGGGQEVHRPGDLGGIHGEHLLEPGGGGTVGVVVVEVVGIVGRDLGAPAIVDVLLDLLPVHRGDEVLVVLGGGHLQEGVGLDRKSTRLNSSHVKISYAVFCLKKKR